jgi:hypothetical protein
VKKQTESLSTKVCFRRGTGKPVQEKKNPIPQEKKRKNMWLLFLSNVLTWSTVTVPSGSSWSNTGLITCSGTSFAYNNVPAQHSTHILVGNAQQWNDPSPPWDFSQGNLELFMWSLTSGSELKHLTVDGTSLLGGNTTLVLPTRETKLSFQYNVSLPQSLEFQVYSPTASTILFSCVRFRAYYENRTLATTTGNQLSGSTTTGEQQVSSTTGNQLAGSTSVSTSTAISGISSSTSGNGTQQAGSTLTTSGLPAWQELLSKHQGEGQSNATFSLEMWLVLANAVIFLLVWCLPTRVRLPPRMSLNQIVRKDVGEIWATNLGHFSVVAYGRKGYYDYPSPHLIGEFFCPFIGFYDFSHNDADYHVYAVSDRIPLRGALEGQDVPLEQKLLWMESVACMIEQAHTHDVGLNPELRQLWVDPVSQSIALADYACRPRPDKRDVHALGKLMEELIGRTGQTEIDAFIDSCLVEQTPSAKECKAAIRYLLSLQSDRKKLRASKSQ